MELDSRTGISFLISHGIFYDHVGSKPLEFEFLITLRIFPS